MLGFLLAENCYYEKLLISSFNIHHHVTKKKIQSDDITWTRRMFVKSGIHNKSRDEKLINPRLFYESFIFPEYMKGFCAYE